MIRLAKVELLHWDVQPHQALTLAGGVTLVTGENGSGKTSILDALKVGLGATRLGGERTIDGYLLAQAEPIAMVRVLVDNRPLAGTRRRPFDALGEHRQDVVTLAVVMRQEDEAAWRRDYYILDGDVVPAVVAGGGDKKARGPAERVLAHKDYLERLRKLGIGREYLKLLCLPQGQIARLCEHEPARLFDALFDVIGGREALDQWAACMSELEAERRRHESVRAEVDHRRLELDLLGARVARHQDYLALARTLELQRAALPHVALASARARAERLAATAAATGRDVAAHDARVHEAQRALTEAEALAEGAASAHAGARERAKAAAQDKDRAVHAHADARARRTLLDDVRLAAEGVTPSDMEALEGEALTLGKGIARGAATDDDHAQRVLRIDEEMARLARGLASFPPEVDRFRDALRRAGIMHHVVAEVLDVKDGADEAWAAALEGYLDRTRFGVLVQDPERWAEAAELARAHRYPHGVLAPDVRGRSPADDEGLNAMVTVGEARYRSLIARLLRRVVPGEPPSPLEPARGAERLAADGFHVTRLEARVAVAEGSHYLGRRALERRRAELEAERAALVAERAAWREERARKERALEAVRGAIAREQKRRAWEAVREAHAQALAEEAAAAERAATAAAEVEARDAEREVTAAAAGDARLGLDRARRALDDAEVKKAALARDLAAAEVARADAAAELGELLATPLPRPDAAVEALVAEGHAPETLRAMLARGERQIEAYEPSVRDALLPVNHARQVAESQAAERQLAAVAERVAATRAAAEAAHEQYREATQRVFRSYFGRLAQAGKELDWVIEGRLVPRDDGKFACHVRVGVGMKALVAHDAPDLSGGQKAALSILMSMTAVSLEADGAAFFLVDEPFSASDVTKMNELGAFLARTGAQYLLSMPTSADLEQCGDWLEAVWVCTRSRGGTDARGRPLLAPRVKLALRRGASGGAPEAG